MSNTPETHRGNGTPSVGGDVESLDVSLTTSPHRLVQVCRVEFLVE